MAGNQGFSLGNTLQQAESIKAARMRNELSQRTLDRDARSQGLREQAVGGNRNALAGLAATDPGGASDLMNTIAQMDAPKREQAQASIDQLGRVAAWVLQSPDPAAAYAQAKTLLTPEFAAQLPEQYDENMMKLAISQAMKLDEVLAAPVEAERERAGEARDIRAENRAEARNVAKEGRNELRTIRQNEAELQNTMTEAEFKEELKRETAKREAARVGQKPSAAKRIKNADSKTLMSYAANSYFGNMFEVVDGTVTMPGLDSETGRKILELVGLSEEIFMREPEIGHARAVQKAARQLGIEPDGTQPQGNALGGQPTAIPPPPPGFTIDR